MIQCRESSILLTLCHIVNHMSWGATRLILLILITGARAFCQNTPINHLDTLAADFIQHIGKGDKERIFVQTDKWIYSAGDDIWLRAYCIGSLSHRVMRESKSLFVDLVSDRDSLVDLIMLNNGLQKLDGRIGLPAGLPRGCYWLRAYTRRMLTEDSLAVYVQPVYVLNSDKRDRSEMIGGLARRFFDGRQGRCCGRWTPYH